MTVSSRRVAAHPELDSRALVQAQRYGDRQHSMFFVLLGLMAANRKVVHKAVQLGEVNSTEHTRPSEH